MSGRSLRHGHREPHFAARLVAAGVSTRVTEIGLRSVTCSGLKKAPFRGVSVLVVTDGHGGAPGLLTRSSHASCHILVATYVMPSHAGHALRVTKGSCDASLAVVTSEISSDDLISLQMILSEAWWRNELAVHFSENFHSPLSCNTA